MQQAGGAGAWMEHVDDVSLFGPPGPNPYESDWDRSQSDAG